MASTTATSAARTVAAVQAASGGGAATHARSSSSDAIAALRLAWAVFTAAWACTFSAWDTRPPSLTARWALATPSSAPRTISWALLSAASASSPADGAG